eukprot:365961-Chlamydomonas_euryale.AAC.15
MLDGCTDISKRLGDVVRATAMASSAMELMCCNRLPGTADSGSTLCIQFRWEYGCQNSASFTCTIGRASTLSSNPPIARSSPLPLPVTLTLTFPRNHKLAQQQPPHSLRFAPPSSLPPPRGRPPSPRPEQRLSAYIQ